MGKVDNTTGALRITRVAWQIAKKKAKEHGVSISKWVSVAIMEKALVDEIIEDEENDSK